MSNQAWQEQLEAMTELERARDLLNLVDFSRQPDQKAMSDGVTQAAHLESIAWSLVSIASSLEWWANNR